jgi:hypothetical protein
MIERSARWSPSLSRARPSRSAGLSRSTRPGRPANEFGRRDFHLTGIDPHRWPHPDFGHSPSSAGLYSLRMPNDNKINGNYI